MAENVLVNQMEEQFKVIIKKLNELTKEENRFISENSKYFQSPDWAKVKDTLGSNSHFILLYSEGKLQNSWLYFTMDVNLLAFKYREIRLETEPLYYTHTEKMLNCLIKNCKEKKYDNILFQINMSNWSLELGEYSKKHSIPFSSIEDFGTCVVDLREDTSTLCKNIHKKHRNVIRKAIKKEYRVLEDKSNESTGNFFNLLNETYKRSNKFGYSEQYLRTLLASEYCRLFTCYSNENEPVASALIAGNRKQAYYLHGASIPNPDGASNYLHWEIMKQLKGEGYVKYDLGGVSYNPPEGSKAYGIKTFKERFGGEFVHVYRGQININRRKTALMKRLRDIYNSSYQLKNIFRIGN